MSRRISLSDRPAPGPRLTAYGAALLALALALPVGLVLALLDWLVI